MNEDYSIRRLKGSLVLPILVGFSTAPSALRRMNRGMAQEATPLGQTSREEHQA